jgi:spore coat polysaccharide biosynthesis protein SpsF
MQQKTVAIIQARMSSTRLPGKVLADISGQPMLAYVVNRAKKAQTLDRVVVATAVDQANQPIVDFCQQADIVCYQGSENDVLDRYYQTARNLDATVVVRLTADCPLLDPQIIDRVVNVFHSGNYDYVSNALKPTYPDGLDTEVFSFQTLEFAWREAKLKSEREHVTSFIYKHVDRFRLFNVEHDVDLSAQRWTVDEPADLELVRAIYRYFKTRDFGMNQIVALLQQYPTLQAINAGFERNEGYHKSLREDGLG